ncbi:MAG: DNA topoisomerase IV subunit A [Candidatus Odyssella sp.]|nr:DNA topoisomerase IV subunit A [Candidatus Odyssella sp.]
MPDDLPFAAELRDAPLADALGERYLAYALSTIMSRSLPDVRDGLKPVHRRLLYAMRELRLDPQTAFKKCARIVGDVMGKYHPHGDASIYDAMVRLAQDFAVRYPLVDGQGNFGNIDGDNPAAMRYTEARLTEVAQRLLEGIDEDAVDFRATYDGEGSEPVVLPANFPNLLANGAAGIAVGMATSIPPHNVAEICDALERLIEKEKLKGDKVSIRELVNRMPGPDFPTGGEIVEPFDNIVEAYKTGKGSFRLRAKWEVEKTKGGGYVVVVTEIPYQVPKSRLVERIAELLQEKKLPLLGDVRDESAEDIRLVLEPKSRNVEAPVLMEHLFAQTDLETRVPLNMNVLDRDKSPKVMNLGEVLRAFLDHRREVLIRRSEFRLEKIAERLEILKGYMVAYINLDEVIRIIRREDEPKPVMMKRFKITEAQAEAILNMRLRQLRKLDEIEIKREITELTKEQGELKGLVGSEKRQWQTLGTQIAELREAFGPKTPLGRRRTKRGDAPAIEVAEIAAPVEKEPVTVICSEKGWIRALGGHLEDAGALQFKEGDALRFLLHAQSTDRLLLFGSDGKFYTLPVEKLPRGRGHGEPVRLSIDLGNEHEIVALFVHDPERKLLVASSDGRGFIVPEKDVAAQTRAGKQALNLAEGVAGRVCAPAAGDHIAALGENRKLLIFPIAELPEMSRGRGITLQKFKQGGLADAKAFALEHGLEVRTGSKTRVYAKAELKDWIGQRAQAGRLPPQGFPRSGKI